MKPLKDLTLEEAKEYCDEYRAKSGGNCRGCKLFKMCRHAFGSFDLATPTKEVTLTWHKYPDDPPSVTGEYLVLSNSFVDKSNRDCRIGFFNKEKDSFPWFSGVYAWAEFPARFDWSDAE